MSRLEPTLTQEFASAMAWWHMAGVDCDFADDATTWLTERAPAGAGALGANPTTTRRGGPASQPDPSGAHPRANPSAFVDPPARAAPERRNLLGDSPPADLAAFGQWWLESPMLDDARGFPRVLPRGPQNPALMVLVCQPEAEDRDTLLSGAQGRLLANILAAMGLDDSAVYIAAALPAHRPLADLGQIAASGMDAVTAHHVQLVAPERLIAFGAGLAPMLGAKGDEPLRQINHAGGTTPVLPSETLDALMDMPRLKARFWRRWIEWSATH